MPSSYTLLSIQVGTPVTYPPVEPDGKPWRSAIVKHPVDGPVMARTTGLDGDKQSDPRVHGGPNRAINVYPAEHYAVWRAAPGLEAMTGGAFGENFTTLGLLEDTACIGDVFRVGQVLVEISQPRGPCFKLNRRWNVEDLQQRAEQERRFGWYLRVREEGLVEAGQEMALLERPYPQWTVRTAWDLRLEPIDAVAVRALIACPALSEDWKRSLQKRLPK